MKDFRQLLSKKQNNTGRISSNLDQQTVSYVFQAVVQREYGRLGSENIKLVSFGERKISLKVTGALWENEIWLNKAYLLQKINEQLGGVEIVDLTMAK